MTFENELASVILTIECTKCGNETEISVCTLWQAGEVEGDPHFCTCEEPLLRVSRIAKK